MQAKWNHEIRDLTRSEAFMNWYRQYNILRESAKITGLRLTELRSQASMMALKAEATQKDADDAVYRAGEYDDLSLMAQAEFAEIENTSFEQLSQFETERKRSTDSWQVADRLEKVVEDERQTLSDLLARAEAARRVGTAEGLSEADRLQVRTKELENTLGRMVKDATDAKKRMDQMQVSRDQLWVGVQESWSRAFRANMARAEYAYQARRVRADAEEQFGKAAQERRRIDSLNEEAKVAEQQVLALRLEFKAHLERGREAFHCAIVDEFLYWPQQEKVTGVWTVPLLDERRHLNLQLQALQVYQLERGTGLDAVEPVADSMEGYEADARLDAFFSSAKKEMPAHVVTDKI